MKQSSNHEAEGRKSKSRGPSVQRKPLKPRDYQVDLESRLGKTQLNSGKVVAVGPGLHDKAGNRIPIAVKKVDTVLLPEYGSTQVMLGEKEFHLYQDEDILRTLHN
ncbi:10 kDa chaperonin [Capsicum chacoense]|uniref:10 kDa chaperonin n=1 Tax=Capsicum annuum TaxID=4072 RepID=UPI0007BED252|nr:10 kDa chaperonin [Capsicum annuum]XP_016569217.1 10 kDa chaperonin [Capsicum annuum]XP_016569218.1 10 kDa chaperonin [Capsicum annuum]XP_047266914.1 10 kDa chaperonin [Capsicum annuum]KAF3631169.1 10 kDa chaperonin [Capsicum annuum]